MTVVKLALIGAMLLAPCAAAYARWDWDAGRSLPLSLGGHILLLYMIGLALPFSTAVACVGVADAVCLFYFVLRAGGVRRLLGFVSVPAVLFVLGIPLLYYACCDRLYLSYDEYSHWGLIVKVISLYDELPRAGAGASLLLYNYPPAGAMLPSLCATLLGYREGVAYFGHTLVLWGLLLGLIPEKGSAFFRTMSAAVLFLGLMTLFPFAILRLFSEPLIALLFALLAFYAVQGERTRMEWARTVVLVCVLALTKNTALIFVALYLLVRLCVRPGKCEGKRCAALALCAVAAYGTYAVYAHVQGIEPAFASHIAQNLRALLNGTLDESHTSAPGRFIHSFFTTAFPQSGVYFTYGVGTSAAVMVAVLLALCGVQAALEEAPRRRMLRLWGGVWLGAAAYNVFTLCSYVVVFTSAESQDLSEFYRYVSLPMLWTGLLWCALTLERLSRSCPRVRCAAVCAGAVVTGALGHPTLMYETLVTRSNVQDTVWARMETERLASLLRGELGAGEKVFLMGNSSQIALRYEMIAEADFGHPEESWNTGAYVGTAEGVQAAIREGGYTYVVVTYTDGDGARAVDVRYAPLFEGGEAAIQPFSLYRVEPTAEGVRLFYVATAV